MLDSGLVAEQRHGRERRYRLVPEELAEIYDWLSHYERFWEHPAPEARRAVCPGGRRMTVSITYQLYLPTSPDRVWAVLTDSAAIEEVADAERL